MAQSNDKLIRSWPKFILTWLKLVQSWFELVPRWLKLRTLGSKTDLGRLKLRTWRSKMYLGTKSLGARRHQGGTREAPRRHQGGTEEAPRRHRGTSWQWKRVLGHTIIKEYRTIAINHQFDLTRSGHKARRNVFEAAWGSQK